MSAELADVELNMVTTPEEADQFLRWLGERRPGMLAVDTETTGFEWWTPQFTRLVQFGDAMTGWTVSARDWLGVIRMALTRYDGPIAFHNAKFDLHALENAGLPIPDWSRVQDTVALHHLQDSNRSHGLKPLSVERYGWAAGCADKMLKEGFKRNGWNWATVPEDFEPYGLYAAMDTVLTARAYDEIMPDIKRRGMSDCYEREMECMATMFRCERRGMLVDPVYALNLRDRWAAEIAALRAELAGYGLDNPGSPKQVAEALSLGGWDPSEFTETGQPKLDKVILAEIMSELGVPAEIAVRVQRYRRLVKWTSAYLDAFLGKRSDAAWRTHPSINVLGARTGRMSITGPPLQTLPKGPEIRHCILPYEGDSLYAIDYDAQELRLFAHFAQERGLMEAFETGQDLHRYTAALAYGVPYDDVTDTQRGTAKNTRYSQLYGAGPAKIASTAGVSVSEIEHFIRASDSVFPGIPEFMQHVDLTGRQRLADSGQPYVWTWGGRYLPCDPDKIYTLVNYLIQGTAADLIKDRIVRLDKAGYGDWIIAPVHDELLFSVPPDGVEYMDDVATIMEARSEFSVPITVERSGPFSTWGTKYMEGH